MPRHLAIIRSLAALLPLVVATGPARAQQGFPVVTGSNAIAAAQLILPTTRYDHFVQGRNYEAGGLQVQLRSGEMLTLTLPDDLVFEDTAPRLGDLDGDGTDEIVVVMSSLSGGASIAAFAIENEEIILRARTEFIGQPHRWRNIAGLGDFDGDGRLDIASVAMPHLVKRLEFHTLDGDRLVRIGSGDGFSNHRLGSVHAGMAVTADFDGDGIIDLALPGADRSSIRVMSFASRILTEIARFDLPAPADGAMRLNADGTISVGLETGRTLILETTGQ